MSTQQPGGGLRQRFQWTSYGFIPGLLLGILLGWVFSGFFTWIIRFGFAFVVLLILAAIFFAWRWFTSRDTQSQVIVYEYQTRPPGEAIDTRSRVVDGNSGYPER